MKKIFFSPFFSLTATLAGILAGGALLQPAHAEFSGTQNSVLMNQKQDLRDLTPEDETGLISKIVVMSDMHIGRENAAAHSRIISDINKWKDISLVAVTGDFCEKVCDGKEFSMARNRLLTIEQPLTVIAGNHDYANEDKLDSRGHTVRAGQMVRRAKLQRIKENLPPNKLHYHYDIGKFYHLIFLPSQHETSPYRNMLSDVEINWLKEDLREHRDIPTIIFAHAPLKNTLPREEEKDMYMEPVSQIGSILAKNKQVLLWVSGHTHTKPGSPGFNHPSNKYNGQLTVIHNPDTKEPSSMWTNSLFLYPNRVVVRTYDHQTKTWLREHRRVFPVKSK